MLYYRMAVVSPNQLASDIQAGKFKPSYYFFGEEDYRIAEAEKFVARHFLPNRQMITNYSRIDGRRTPVADLLAELQALPMLGERQVIVVMSFQSYRPDDIGKVAKMLTPPDPNRIVIFSSPSDKMPKAKSAFFRTISSLVDVVVKFDRLTPDEAVRTFRKLLAGHQMSIEDDALRLFTEMIAGNRGALEREADKLIEYKERTGTVTIDDIRMVCSGFEVYDVFKLADYVVDGDRRQVMKMLHRLMAGGDVSGTILFSLGQHFINLYLLRTGGQLPSKYRWLARNIGPQARRFSEEQLERYIIRTAETQSDMRRGRVKAEAAMEMLVLSLLENPGR
ncbi:MAG: DNA polymerase III subunit delta [candidate division Zixibacteria bacterium]|nr:DNA polymerase III subunit delta [candidate division Zixibacteria bacterium]